MRGFVAQAAVCLAFIFLFFPSVYAFEGDIGNAINARRRQRKRQFKRELDAAIQNETDLDPADEDEYTDYVDAHNKLDEYLDRGVNFTRRYRAYERNKRRIQKLNANATRVEVVHGKEFRESYAINFFTDCDDECRAEYVQSLGFVDERRRMAWKAMSDCIELDQDYFADVNASNTELDTYARKFEECGAIKNQGSLGTCWAFASTAQLQCNYNAAMQETRVFSVKYATDCSTDEEGSTNGGWDALLTLWYEDAGACSDYYKEYDDDDRTNYNGDCDCNVDKVYGQCYQFYPDADANGALAIANAAQLHALSFGVSICNSFFDLHGDADKAVWYGCDDGDEIVGGHAMAIVGQWYGSYVLVRNSWWSGWSGDGHVWFHPDVWSSKSRNPNYPFTFNYFRSQDRTEHENPSAVCHEQGPCDSGYMDATDGAYNWNGCGADCEGGTYYTDNVCNCACQAAGTCDSLPGYDNFNVYRYVPHIRFFRYFGWIGDYVAGAVALAVVVALWCASLKLYATLIMAKPYVALKEYDSEADAVENGNESEMEKL